MTSSKRKFLFVLLEHIEYCNRINKKKKEKKNRKQQTLVICINEYLHLLIGSILVFFSRRHLSIQLSKNLCSFLPVMTTDIAMQIVVNILLFFKQKIYELFTLFYLTIYLNTSKIEEKDCSFVFPCLLKRK